MVLRWGKCKCIGKRVGGSIRGIYEDGFIGIVDFIREGG